MIKREDVEFTVEIYPDDTPVRGRVWCGDAVATKEAKDEILARLDGRNHYTLGHTIGPKVGGR